MEKEARDKNNFWVMIQIKKCKRNVEIEGEDREKLAWICVLTGGSCSARIFLQSSQRGVA